MSLGAYNKIVNTSSKMTDHRKFVPPDYKPMLPTNKQYRKGKFTRYFCISNLDERVIEIDEVQFGSILKPNKGIDQAYWKGVQLKWKLKGPRFDKFENGILVKRGVVTVNQERVDKILKKYPQFIKAIPSMITYATLDPELRENLYAAPGMLVFKGTDQEYIGPYHFHPEKGPMEGAKHRSASHALLDFAEGYDPSGVLSMPATSPTSTDTSAPSTETPTDTSAPSTPTPPASTPAPPPSTGGSYSSGGGGGGGGGGGY